MKSKINTIILLTLITFYACNHSPEYFIGKWQILKVVENNVSSELNENWIHLRSNRTFESYDGEQKMNESGKWIYHTKEKILLIDGEGEKGDSQWALSMKNDTLIFQSTSHNLYLVSKKIE